MYVFWIHTIAESWIIWKIGVFVFNTVELQDSTGSHDIKLVFWQFMSSHSFKQARRIRLSESFATKRPSLPTTMFCISFERRNLISGHFCWPLKLLRAWFFYLFFIYFLTNSCNLLAWRDSGGYTCFIWETSSQKQKQIHSLLRNSSKSGQLKYPQLVDDVGNILSLSVFSSRLSISLLERWRLELKILSIEHGINCMYWCC